MRTLRPFYASQTQTGETYVVDGRSNKVVRTVVSSFDTTERWREAQRIANKLNAANVTTVYARRRALALLVVLALLVAVTWVVSSRLLSSGQ
jgi:hypothetical protein